ncbi:MAG: hypothetical protein Q7S39_05925 [Ignavibacteria bacterium]|nr:hypothetical protein [Ignavibacteria bacterium]
MKNFKKLILLVFLIIPFLTNGCYTVLWTPDEDFPDESNYEYYDAYYIDEYHYYYDYPWWLSFTPPTKTRTDNGYNRDDDTQKIRNSGNGRNNSDSRNEVINTPPPTRNYTPSDNGSDNSSGNNNNTNTETKRTESVNSNNSSNNSRQDSNSNNNNVRNNDGNRNNGRNR